MPSPAAALIVVDVQQDFCEGGSLAVAGGAASAAAISDLIGSSGDLYELVVATRDWHIDPGRHFALAGVEPNFVDTWPPHCIAGTTGADWHPDLRLPPAAVVISKGEHEAAFSGFQGHDTKGRRLDQVLRESGVGQVDVVGIATSYCVKATALDAAAAGFTTRVIPSLTADVDPSATDSTLETLRQAGVEVAL